jgi:hypothetical protein
MSATPIGFLEAICIPVDITLDSAEEYLGERLHPRLLYQKIAELIIG